MEPRFPIEFVSLRLTVLLIPKNSKRELADFAIHPAISMRRQGRGSVGQGRQAPLGHPQDPGTLKLSPSLGGQAEERACTSWQGAQPIRPEEQAIGGSRLRLPMSPRR